MNIYSLNCNGLSDDVKRNAVFEKLKKKGEGIFLLQETHCTAENEQKWRSEWCNNMYFSSGTSNARGVAIIITENYEYKKLMVEKDTEGRFLILEIERQGTIYTIGNIYAPTRNFERDQQRCFLNFTTQLETMQSIHTILGVTSICIWIRDSTKWTTHLITMTTGTLELTYVLSWKPITLLTLGAP